MSQPMFLSDTTVAGSGWTYIPFGFNPKFLISLAADRANTDDLYMSDDGQNIRYRLQPGEPFNLTSNFINGIYLKPKSGTQAYRLFAN